MNRLVIALFFLVALVAAEKKTLRHGRRNVLEVETKERAAELLDSLWAENGIKKPNNRKRDLKGSSKSSKSSSSSKSMSFYYY